MSARGLKPWIIGVRVCITRQPSGFNLAKILYFHKRI